MFARKAFFRLKSINLSSEFRQTFDTEVLPLLRSQKGFVGELTLENPGSLERIAISLWETRADAEAYDKAPYQQVLKILAKTIDGKPKIHTYDSVVLALDHRTA